MTKAIDLSPSDAKIVRDILRFHLPPGTSAFVFGSHATATARRYSDLDLALQSENPLSAETLGNVTEALSKSDLPYKVDAIDLRSVDPAFKTLIEPDLIPLEF